MYKMQCNRGDFVEESRMKCYTLDIYTKENELYNCCLTQ